MRLPHGYTNETELTAAGDVRKCYVGKDAKARQRVEAACLTALTTVLPVPAVVAVEGDATLMQLRPGEHGQDLLEQGHGEAVLLLAGQLLRRLGAVSPALVMGLGGQGEHVVHGDFGPQNMLFDLGRESVTAVLDWEYAHRGDPIEDLAWCEWIVRMHHPDQVSLLRSLFAGYGERPPWAARRQIMIEKCELFEERSRAEGPENARALWAERTQLVRTWHA